jgi:uncharacterized protein YraI
MPFRFNVLGAALGIIAVAAAVGPGRAQNPSSPEPVPDGRTAAVTANVNLRSGPGTDSEIITTIPAGSTVRLASCSAEWCEVTWNGRGGYAIARSLSGGSPRHARTYGPRPDYTRGYGPGRQPGYTEGYGAMVPDDSQVTPRDMDPSLPQSTKSRDITRRQRSYTDRLITDRDFTMVRAGVGEDDGEGKA